MNKNFFEIISANPTDRRDLFLATANRLGTTLQNIEKDFWVSWTLDLLFNGRDVNEPRLLFKGGTSLSKAYSLIARFSEDVDITVFREDIGQNIETNNLKCLSGKKQRAYLEAIRDACQTYINGVLKKRLNQQIETTFSKCSISLSNPLIDLDTNDPDQQTLLFYYPTANIEVSEYIKPTVKIEAGARSALAPNQITTVKPYIEGDVPNLDLTVSNIVTINAERTFWDKIVILHGLRRWYDNRGVLRQQGHRISRHYYDIYQLIRPHIAQNAITDHVLALDCANHAQTFFNSRDLDLENATPGSLSLSPTVEMIEILEKDYQAMAGMIFGEVPRFSDVLQAISDLENQINKNIQWHR